MNETQFKSELPRGFQGAFACDELKPPSSLPASYIVNTDPRCLPGKHWVAIFINKNGDGEYFDSFGSKPNEDICKFFKRNCSKVYYNTKRIQHDRSISCGVYCIYFLKQRHNAVPMCKTLIPLSVKDKVTNELKLIRFFMLNFK